MTGDYPILLLVLALAAGILSVILLFLILAKLNRSNPGAETQKILDLLRQGAPFFSLKLRYQGETLVYACLNGKELTL